MIPLLSPGPDDELADVMQAPMPTLSGYYAAAGMTWCICWNSGLDDHGQRCPHCNVSRAWDDIPIEFWPAA